MFMLLFLFFKQKTAYEMRISDWSSDVCSSDLARQMVKQGARPDGSAGAIVNMSSINAVVAIPSITPYCVAKGGVNQLTKVMALALADKGIRVNAIGPEIGRAHV